MPERDEAWLVEIQTHDEIQALYPLVAALSVDLRPHQPLAPGVGRLIAGSRWPGTDEDGMMCALVCKAANTHRAVRLLAEAGHGDDALALSRVLFENAILVEWLRVKPLRLGIFAMAEQVLRRWMVAAVRKLGAQNPSLLRQADAASKDAFMGLAKLFGDVQTRHLFDLAPDGTLKHVSAKAMIKSLSNPQNLAPDDGDLAYFHLSTFVHSSAPSVRHLVTAVREKRIFVASVEPNRANALQALKMSNAKMLLAFSQLCEYAGLEELQEDFDRVKARVVGRSPESSTDATAVAS